MQLLQHLKENEMESMKERIAGYVLAFAIGCGLAVLLVVGWSK